MASGELPQAETKVNKLAFIDFMIAYVIVGDINTWTSPYFRLKKCIRKVKCVSHCLIADCTDFEMLSASSQSSCSRTKQTKSGLLFDLQASSSISKLV